MKEVGNWHIVESNDYEANKKSVMECYHQAWLDIYGVDIEMDCNNFHHVIQKRDVKRGSPFQREFAQIGYTKETINRKSNIIPMLEGELLQELAQTPENHKAIHHKIDEIEHYTGVIYKKKHKKRSRR